MKTIKTNEHVPHSPARIDVHSHVLAGIDDGCRTMEDSVACVRRLVERGYVGTICTPHIWEDFPENTPVNIAGWVNQLQHRLADEGIEYDLWPGGEVRICESTISWFEEHGVTTLGRSRYVLTDFWGDCWPNCGDDVFDWLQDNDYRPILAHPERMAIADRELEALLDSLAARGVELQGNLRCIAGGEGARPQERMRRWLIQGRYLLVASDMHTPKCLDGRLAGIAALEQLVGTQQAIWLLEEQPRRVVQSEREQRETKRAG